MGEVADILKTTHDIFASGPLTLTVDERNLGMAYAIPRGTEDTVIESYGPWHDAEVRQVFYQQSSVLGSVLAEIQMIMSWQYSDAQQYIVDARLTNNVIARDPTVDVNIKVRFSQPRLYSSGLEAYEIPFQVDVTFDPVGDDKIVIYRGTIRSDGTGSFEQI